MKPLRFKSMIMALAALSLSATAHAQSSYDWTGTIINPSFEQGSGGWTLQKDVSGWEDIRIANSGAADGDKLYNIWAGQVRSLDVSQSVELKAGSYSLSAQLKTDSKGLSDQHVYVKTSGGTVTSQQLSQGDDKWEHLSVTFSLESDEKVTIGVASTGDGSDEKGWFCLDDVRLQGSVKPDAYDWTSAIRNASFENGRSKWSLTKDVSGYEDIHVSGEDAADGSYQYNIWAGQVRSLDVSQNVELKAGKYTLSAQLYTNAQGLSDQHLYVNTPAGIVTSPALTQGDDQWHTLSLTFTLPTAANVMIGAASTGDGSNEKGWFRVDDFRLWGSEPADANYDRTLEMVGTNLTVAGNAEYHITGTTPFTAAGSLNVESQGSAVVFFDNLRPTETAQWLTHITIDGQPAYENVNCQLRLYDHGTLLYPYGKEGKGAADFHPLTVYSERYCAGDAYDRFGTENTDGFMNTLTDSTMNDRIRSFRLRRGYMVTFGVGAEGYGYQRCFIADDADLIVNALPEIMDNRISSYRVFRWNNIGKNGVDNTMNPDDLKKLNCTWTYAWGAGHALGDDYECVPHMNNLWSASDYELGANDQSPYLKTDNEPANGADPSPASVTQEMERWPQLMRTGRRLLSPSSFDGGGWWHDWFYSEIDSRGWRCDVTDIHCYWNEGNFNNIKSQWADKYHRPVWITEFIWGASWSGGFGIFGVARSDEDRGNPSQDILNQNRDVCARIWNNLNGMECVERYAYWNDEWPCSKILWNGELTPAGEYFSQMKTGPSYNGAYDYVPNEWRCQAPKNVLATYSTEQKACLVQLQSLDCDLADTIYVQRREADGDWVTVHAFIHPDSVNLHCLDTVDFGKDYTYRAVEKSWRGDTYISDEAQMSRYLINSTVVAENKNKITGWHCIRNAANGYTKGDSGDTYFEVWDADANVIDFNYYQDVTGLPAGVYRLEANVFNSTDGVSDATVNGHVGLYAQAGSLLYFKPVTRDTQLDADFTTTVDSIVVRDGKLRVGIRNIGRMTARWAGADNFRLVYLGTEEKVLGGITLDEIAGRCDEALVSLFPKTDNGLADATGFIMNASCARNTTTFWGGTNLGTNGGKAYDGTDDNHYYDKWQPDALNSRMSQTLVGLPVGYYQLRALLRGTKDLDIKLVATRMAADSTTTDLGTTIKGNDEDAVEGSDLKYGWAQVSTEPFLISRGDRLTVGGAAKSDYTAWWSADDYQLIFVGDNPANGISNISTPDGQPVSTAYYNLQGQRISRPEQGVYIEKTTFANGTSRSVKRVSK